MHLLHQLSLKSLYTFSVAARHLNFTTASQELHITPSAVSHQIKRLEDALGGKLFESEGKQLRLTPEAKRYSLSIEQSFTHINNATKEFLEYDTNVIQIGVNSAFAVKRLTPELGLWQNSFPELDLRLRMNSSKDDIANLNLDVVLSGKISDSKYVSEFICDESYHPVCSQSLFRKMNNEGLQQRLSTSTLIDLTGINCWKDWFSWKGFQTPNEFKTVYFGHTLLMLQAVIAGQGIALLDKTLIKNELDSGELVLLDKEPYFHSEQSYYFSYLKKRGNDANIHTLKKWILALF